jgi:hypothetical protein
VTAPHSQPPPTKITARGLPLEGRGRGYSYYGYRTVAAVYGMQLDETSRDDL